MNPETVFALLFLAVGGWYAWRGLSLVREVNDSSNWPSAEGVVLISEQRRRMLGGGGRTGARHAYSELIRYRYAVNGQTYESEIVELGGRVRSTPRLVAELMQRFPEGARVPVWYHPDRPQTACLLRQGRGGWLWLGGGIFAMATGLALLGSAIG